LTPTTIGKSNVRSYTSKQSKKHQQSSSTSSRLFHQIPTTTTTSMLTRKQSKTSALVNFMRSKVARRRNKTQRLHMMLDQNRPKIAVRSRDKVTYDAETTFVRPEQLSIIDNDNDDTVASFSSPSSRWSKFKEGVYGIVTNLSTVSNKVASIAQQLTTQEENIKKARRENDSVLRRPMVGYDDTIQVLEQPKKTKQEQTLSPGQRLLQQYEALKHEEYEIRSSKVVEEEVIEEEDYFRSDARKSFDGLKDGFYFAFDKVFSSSSKPSSSNKSVEKSTSPKTTPLERIQTTGPQGAAVIELDNFKVQSKSSQSKIENEIQSYIPLLKSSNRITRFRAKLAIQSLERKRSRGREEDETAEIIDETKEKAYDMYDNVRESIKKASTLPFQFIETFQQTATYASDVAMDVSDTVKTLPDTVQKTTTTIRNLPVAIEETATRTKTEVQQKADTIVYATEQTIQRANEFVSDVQNIPTKIESTIIETKDNMERTKQTVQDSVKKLEDSIYDAKVVLRLEKPKPKPPPLPPPPKPMSDLAKEVAWDVAGLSAKITWNAVLGVGSLAGRGAKMAFDAAIANKKKAALEEATATKPLSSPVMATAPKRKAAVAAATTARGSSSLPPTTPETPLPTIAEIDLNLSKEVEDALSLVEATLEKERQRKNSWNIFASENKGSSYFAAQSDEINEALRRAKEAASRATSDVEQLEIIAADEALRRGRSKRSDSISTVKNLAPTVQTVTDDGLDDVLERAKKAAQQASRDAEELEVMLKERR